MGCWMGCWGLLGWSLLVMKWIIPSFPAKHQYAPVSFSVFFYGISGPAFTMTEVQQLWLSQAHHGHAVLPGFCRPNPYPGGIEKPSGYENILSSNKPQLFCFVFFFVGYFEKPSQFLTQLCQIRLWPQPWFRVTENQAYCWPVAGGGRDVVGIAKTGSGKTLATCWSSHQFVPLWMAHGEILWFIPWKTHGYPIYKWVNCYMNIMNSLW